MVLLLAIPYRSFTSSNSNNRNSGSGILGNFGRNRSGPPSASGLPKMEKITTSGVIRGLKYCRSEM